MPYATFVMPAGSILLIECIVCNGVGKQTTTRIAYGPYTKKRKIKEFFYSQLEHPMIVNLREPKLFLKDTCFTGQSRCLTKSS